MLSNPKRAEYAIELGQGEERAGDVYNGTHIVFCKTSAWQTSIPMALLHITDGKGHTRHIGTRKVEDCETKTSHPTTPSEETCLTHKCVVLGSNGCGDVWGRVRPSDGNGGGVLG